MAAEDGKATLDTVHQLVRGLGRTVERLERAIGDEADATGLAHRTALLAHEVSDLQVEGVEVRRQLEELPEVKAAVEKLAEQVENLAQDSTDKPRPVSWPHLSADEAAERIVPLARWIGEVVVHYPDIREFWQPCWHQHLGLVQYLDDLRGTYEESYAHYVGSADKGPGKWLWALDWHNRFKEALLGKLKLHLRGCGAAGHKERDDFGPLGLDEGELTAFARWEAGGRQGPRPGGHQRPPEPSPMPSGPPGPGGYGPPPGGQFGPPAGQQPPGGAWSPPPSGYSSR